MRRQIRIDSVYSREKLPATLNRGERPWLSADAAMTFLADSSRFSGPFDTTIRSSVHGEPILRPQHSLVASCAGRRK